MNGNYKDWSKEELIDHVRDLESKLDDVLLNNDNANFVQFEWAGNLGQWHWYVKENKVIFNDKKVEAIGYDPKKVGDPGFKFFTEKLHPDDYDRVMENMRNHLAGKSEAYEVEYRIKHKDGHYLWYYDRGSVIKRSDEGKPLLLQGIVFDISESKKIEEKLRYLSERDPLTNVYNRRTMFNILEDLIKKANKEDTFSLVMFDIDHFKKVNDQYGHLVGDDVLKKMVELVIEEKRSDDVVCRYGGEEFFLLLPKTRENDAIKVAKRIHEKIKTMDIPKVGHITVSMGVVTYQENETIDEVVKRADDLMYEAKEAGRDNVKY